MKPWVLGVDLGARKKKVLTGQLRERGGLAGKGVDSSLLLGPFQGSSFSTVGGYSRS